MFQKITIVGNLGKDPEMRYTPGGTPVTNLNVGTNRKYTNGDGKLVKESTWFRVSVFGAQAEACGKYLKKGAPVLVEGRLTPDKDSGGPRVYQRPDGTTGAAYEVNASQVVFLPKGGGSGAADNEAEDDEESLAF